ncbi:MAG: hypothetical protein DMG41_10340 [Acidobacteria bacterium]|nr:MAG: hypothetical protein DMG42_00835 [Acidobacteriota bacterium]PYT88729.1 MAG: hypothetical protein DMG41_10340 [Acidobacteriota bacterium]
MSFLPVAAAPAVPAPAPAAAPIAAPLPPPASAPMAAPPAAPPPINPASRLPLPFSVLPAELVAKVYALPLTVTLTKCRYNFAGVDSRPEACTPLTDNFAVAPLGISTLPPMVTFLATVAETGCPAFASLELTGWSVTTEMTVPFGTVPAAAARAPSRNAAASEVRTRPMRKFISVASHLNCLSGNSSKGNGQPCGDTAARDAKDETPVRRSPALSAPHTDCLSVAFCR